MLSGDVLRTSNNIALEGTRKSLRDGEDAVSTILIWTKHRFQAGIILGLMILMLEGALAFLALTAIAIITLGFLIRLAAGSDKSLEGSARVQSRFRRWSIQEMKSLLASLRTRVGTLPSR